MLSDLFAAQKKRLSPFFDSLCMPEAEAVFEKLFRCEGALLLTGVGKSGHIARKIAATFVSTGTRARFLCPVDALHGDLGMAEKGDCLLAFSNSGESEEILQILPFLERKGVFRISVVSRPFSRMEALSDLTMHLPLVKELCPYGLTPTISTAAQLLFGDGLAIALLQARGFRPEHFAENHPGGLLGKKMHLRVGDLMRKKGELPLCEEQELLKDTLGRLSSKRMGCLLVVERDRLVGIFTDGDLQRGLTGIGPSVLEKPMRALMNPSFRWTTPEKKAIEALEQMEEDPKRAITVLPVLEEGVLVGLIQMHDILQTGLAIEKGELCLQ